MKLIFVGIFLIAAVGQKLVAAEDEVTYNTMSKMENPSVLEEYFIQDDPERITIISRVQQLIGRLGPHATGPSFGGYGGYGSNYVSNAGGAVEIVEVISPDELEIQRLEQEIAEIEAAIIAHGGVVPDINEDDYNY